MKAVILAGGRGTRLAPVTHGAVPKPMAELLGAPMLEHIVALLKRCGFRDLCCTTACLPEQIERYTATAAASACACSTGARTERSAPRAR